MIIKIATMFSNIPGSRYISDGEFSGEEFRTKLLEPAYLLCSEDNKTLIIDLDGSYGYSTGFLEESFGGLVRLGYSYKKILNTIEFISLEEPQLIDEIKKYIIEEGLRTNINKKNIYNIR